MAIKKSKLTSAEAREQYTKWRRTRNAVKNLVIPELPNWWPSEPGFEALVPRDEQDNNMEIVVPSVWANPAFAGEFDYIWLEVKRKETAIWNNLSETRLVGPVTGADFPMPLTLDSTYFSAAGEYEVRYQVRIDNGTVTPSGSVDFIIDKSPPHHGGQRPDPLTFRDTNVGTDGITQAYLDANAAGVPMLVPIYNDEQPGDEVHVLYSHPYDPGETTAYRGPIGAGRTIFIPVGIFSGVDDGRINFAYFLSDKVGNQGTKSLTTGADLLLKPLPVPPLAAPRVPLAEDFKTLIDRADVLVGVDVVVQRYTHWLAVDRIVVTWGGEERDEYPVGGGAGDIVIPMPYEVIRSAYDTSGGSGEVATTVSYVVKRGNKEFGSDDTDIFVDLSYVGPVNPTDPEIVNPNLPPITVVGTGTLPETREDNKLYAEDIGLPAEASFTIPADFDDVEQVDVYWGQLEDPVATTRVIPTQGSPLTLSIAWVDIEKVPGGLVPVYYKISSGPTDNNPQSSESTDVDVSEAVPIKLGDPTFPDAGTDGSANPILNCSSFIGPDQHVQLRIPGNPQFLSAGDPMTITWQAYSDRPPTNPVGITWTHDIAALSTDEVENGFVLQVRPFVDHIEPVGQRGTVIVTYEATSDGATFSGTTTIYASSVNAEVTCPINP